MSGHQNRTSGKNFVHNPSRGPTKGQRSDAMARKREERAARAAHKKQRQAKTYLADDETYVNFKGQLAKMGLELRDITGDGNCLFRALGDQLDGHGRNHLKHRRDVVNFMLDNRDDFEPFVEDDVPFDKHVKNLNEIGTYAGNDAIVAFSRLNTLHVVIHQVNTPCWQIHGTDNPAAKELHISYHNGDHYSSIRKLGDMTETPANIRLDNTVLSHDPTKKDKAKEENGYAENAWETGSAYMYEDPAYSADFNDFVPDDDGDSKLHRSNDDIIESIKRLTCCEDESLILQTLEDVDFNLEVATDLILNIMQTSLPEPAPDQLETSEGLWSEDGTGSRLFGSLENHQNGDVQSQGSSQNRANLGAKPKQQSASRLKQTKKQEKKLRAEQRRRQERLGDSSTTSGGGGGGVSGFSSDDDFTVVADVMGTLKI